MIRRQRRARNSVKSEINIVPLLDVLLVLLLIFMATAPIITQSVSVDLPEVSDSQTVNSDEKPPVIIEVRGIGQYSIKVGKDESGLLPAQQIIAQAQQYLQDNPQAIFLIAGAKEVPYEEVIKALDALRKAGVKSVGLMSKPV